MKISDELERLENHRRLIWRFVTRAWQPDVLEMLFEDLERIEGLIQRERCCDDQPTARG